MTDPVQVLCREEVVADVPGVVGQLSVGPPHLRVPVTDLAVFHNLKLTEEPKLRRNESKTNQ